MVLPSAQLTWECDLYWNWRVRGPSYTFPVVSPAAFIICTTFIFGDVLCSGDLQSLGRLSSHLATSSSTGRSPGILKIGAPQLNNWRLHEPHDFLPHCHSGALPTRLLYGLVPRHYFRLPGQYTSPPVLSEDLSSEKTERVTSTPTYVALTQNSKRLYLPLL